MTSLPVVVRPPKNPNKDLTAVESRADQLALLNRHQKRTVRTGWLIVFLFFGVLGGWAAAMPLSGAIIANGSLVVQGRNKPVQHYGGGIVAEVLVKTGDVVQAGDVVVRLDPTNTRASAEISESRYFAALAEEARLLAERDNDDHVTYPRVLLDVVETKPEVQTFIDAQEKVFEARRVTLDSQGGLLKERILQSREEITGLTAQIQSVDTQLSLIQDELESVQYLFDQGLAPKARLLALQRQEADLIGRKGRLESTVARTEQSINEVHLRDENLRDRFYADVVERLKNVRATLKDLEERRTVAAAAAERTDVRAPATGIIQELEVSTIGQVVANGQVLMEIVPLDTPMQIALRISPADIDDVYVGQKANIQLLFYNFRTFSKKLHGEVSFVGADISKPDNYIDAQKYPTGYYEMKVILYDEDIERYRKSDNIELFNGAPVMVILPTIDRTVLEYLLGPIMVGLEQAFRER